MDKKIECIEDVKGIGRELYLYIACDDLHDHDLRDLIGLFYRYKKDMKTISTIFNARKINHGFMIIRKLIGIKRYLDLKV